MPTVKGPINYGRDGKEIPPGTVFEVPADEAEHLISRYGFELVEEQTSAERPPLEKLKLVELQELAKQYGLTPPEGATRAILIDAIRAVEATAAAPPE